MTGTVLCPLEPCFVDRIILGGGPIRDHPCVVDSSNVDMSNVLPAEALFYRQKQCVVDKSMFRSTGAALSTGAWFARHEHASVNRSCFIDRSIPGGYSSSRGGLGGLSALLGNRLGAKFGPNKRCRQGLLYGNEHGSVDKRCFIDKNMVRSTGARLRQEQFYRQEHV